jgi:hypothetical protein
MIQRVAYKLQALNEQEHLIAGQEVCQLAGVGGGWWAGWTCRREHVP